ncbi:MAG: hypothetical protein LBS64_04820 [Spirochaetaceae bacterium]|jgi:hypothetical protein|nr:hypothetical protein [Spirochaetaceae bacterium]
MKRFSLCILMLAMFLPSSPLHPYAVIYKEEYYRLYHIHAQQHPDDAIENIYWLEKAAKVTFCNPKYALVRIENETDWEKYRALFMMHVNLKLIEQHLRLGKNYDKQVAYFYDAPWKDEYLRQLERADTCYRTGLAYWEEALSYFRQANDGKFRFLFLTGVQNWEDERERIATGKLDYARIIQKELARLEQMRAVWQEKR